ncbi:3-oxoacyl-(acyl-carrier-protein) synthase II [Desulfamplus magnetovallimortis]|uniref:3-oxoacyl-(Acyl-carrier-protein) synthase II n=1 Tax=Desulfamplus magnetovallimortis TaxID=1246637 RepID=L0R731_9BACT|nr:beta-ketoacyl synthase N-terminal-like domain-containing protein [Desulfamplus magnetovallimortis]CCO06776.1 3-oxoacyl-(acyl-carrier-protein) synthase II [Desulfamplus magnetovallimortis BW-1]SLM32827.1 3-oxoacyl-(acyl-carrier-protein) synthase II [Desulfamplus magnetovallimortis]
MTAARVVITGKGVITGMGCGMDALISGIEKGKCATRRMPGWERYKGLRSLIGVPVDMPDYRHIPRKIRRSMGRLSLLTLFAADEALSSAGIKSLDFLEGKCGCVVGSTMGGAEALNDTFETMLPDHDLSKLSAMKFFHTVSHTAAMNLAQYLGLRGIVMATSAACASSLQAVGTGFDLIRNRRQSMVLCGGAEELHPTVTGSFDILFASSTNYNDIPEKSPRPFDKDRDGIVCGEGAGILVLEDYEHAVERGANILAEIRGYHTCSSGSHVSQAHRESMIHCMNMALSEADILPSKVDLVSAHATATRHGDEEEAQAIATVFGANTPVQSLKGYIGHTLGASGSIELAVVMDMMKQNMIYPTCNLEVVDNGCDVVFHVRETLHRSVDVVLKNCFAFGGINASLVCTKFKPEI